MSERSFFNFRYSIPGYIFLIFMVMVYPGVIRDISTIAGSELIGLIIGIMSGPALGFLISQIWYTFYYNSKKMNIYKNNRELRKYMNYLHKKYKIKNDPEILECACNFLYSHYNNDTLREYGNRRWDLFRIMGISKLSIIFGLICGVVFLFFNNKINFCNQIAWIGISIMISAIFYETFRCTMKLVEREHDNIVYLILHDMLKTTNSKKMRRFPECYYYE